MALTKLQKDVCITMIDCTLIFLITILHFVSFFLIKKSDFTDIFDTYESSPLFGFNLVKEDNCGTQSSYTFQVWDGWEERGKGRYADTFGECWYNVCWLF